MGPFRAAPAFIALLALIGALVAASLIDAKHYVIPAAITTFATATGMAGLVIQAFIPESTRAAASAWWAVPLPGWIGVAAGIGGATGLGAAWILLRLGVIKPSFADYEEYVAPGATLADYPHARREMVRELVFLAPCVAGLATVILLQPSLQSSLPDAPPPLWLAALGASCLGIVVGGGMLWAIRILGSLAFGREAMGMGDIHLMAAVGATVGWAVPVVAFIPAVFVALGCTLAIRGLAILRRRGGRELPLGPYLAAGVLLVIFFRPAFVEAGRWIAPALIPEELPGLFTNDPRSGGITSGAAESARRGPIRAGNRF
jgi:leader peptidase (prepilin peptidase)/N-methyltransferase